MNEGLLRSATPATCSLSAPNRLMQILELDALCGLVTFAP